MVSENFDLLVPYVRDQRGVSGVGAEIRCVRNVVRSRLEHGLEMLGLAQVFHCQLDVAIVFLRQVLCYASGQA